MNNNNIMIKPLKKEVVNKNPREKANNKSKLSVAYIKKVIEFLDKQNTELQNKEDTEYKAIAEEEIEKMKLASQALGIKYAKLLELLKNKSKKDPYKENIKRQKKDNIELKKEKDKQIVKQIILKKLHHGLIMSTSKLKINSEKYSIFLNKCEQFKHTNQNIKTPSLSKTMSPLSNTVEISRKSYAARPVSLVTSLSPRSTPKTALQNQLFNTLGKPGSKDYYGQRNGSSS